MAFVEQTKAGITVPPKSAEEVAQIKNPFPMDAPDEKIMPFEISISRPKPLTDTEFSVPEGFDRKKPDVKYGEIKTISYYSTTTENNRNATLILPPSFDGTKKFPVLYLLHGIGGNEREWLGGNPNEVINNLVAEGKTKEMIVVIPNIRARHRNAEDTADFSAGRFREFDNFLYDLRDNLMPYIEKNYPVLPGRDNRAVAGLSMGGRSALQVGIHLSDYFAFIGAFTPAPGVLPSSRGDGLFTKETFTLPKEYRRNTLIMITKGSTDGVVRDNPPDYSTALKENEIEHLYTVTEGGHDFGVWKHNLYNFVRRIFR
jgi:enterochelin esterase-like enzyme